MHGLGAVGLTWEDLVAQTRAEAPHTSGTTRHGFRGVASDRLTGTDVTEPKP